MGTDGNWALVVGLQCCCPSLLGHGIPQSGGGGKSSTRGRLREATFQEGLLHLGRRLREKARWAAGQQDVPDSEGW